MSAGFYPTSDPEDGRVCCTGCGRYVWPIIHSCKGMPARPTLAESASLVHIAGHEVQVGEFLRQRCAWCGAVLADYDLSRLMYTEDTPPEKRHPATWRMGALVLVEGNLKLIVDHNDGDRLPDNACAMLDVEVTR